MILLPQSVLGDCYSVFRRAGPKSSVVRSATSVHISGSRDGTLLALV